MIDKEKIQLQNSKRFFIAGWIFVLGAKLGESASIKGSKLAGIYMLKVNYRNTRTRCKMFKVNNKDTKTTPIE